MADQQQIEHFDVIDSSNVASADFDAEKGEISVMYHRGGPYTFPCSAEKWANFKAAASKGSYLRHEIAGII